MEWNRECERGVRDRTSRVGRIEASAAGVFGELVWRVEEMVSVEVGCIQTGGC